MKLLLFALPASPRSAGFLLLFLLTAWRAQSCPMYSSSPNVYIFGIDLLASNRFREYYYDFPHGGEFYCEWGKEANQQEWQKQFPGTSTEDLGKIIYNCTPDTLQLIGKAMQGKGKNPLPGNGFARLLISTHDETAMDYLLAAKQSEGYSGGTDGWENKPEADPDKINALIQLCIDRSKSNLPVFYKQRYALQAIRLSLYNAKGADIPRLFSELITPDMPKGYAYYRTLLYLAGVSEGDKDAHLIAQVFVQYPPLRCKAYLELRFTKANPAAMPDAESKAAIYFANAVIDNANYIYRSKYRWNENEPSPDFNKTILERMFQELGATDHTEVMLIKCLKEIEANYFLPHLQIDAPLDSAAFKYGAKPAQAKPERSWLESTWQSVVAFFKSLFGMEEPPKDLPVVSKYYSFTENHVLYRDLRAVELIHSIEKTTLDMVTAPGAPNPALYYAAAAYLEIMKKDFEKANLHLDKAKEILAANEKSPVYAQTMYLKTLSAVMQADTMNVYVEKIVDDNFEYCFNSSWQRLLLFSELGRRYLKTGKFRQAVLAFSTAGRDQWASGLIDVYMSAEELEKMITAIEKGSYTPFERTLLQWFTYSTEDLTEALATKLMREGKFEQAVAVFKKIPAQYWKQPNGELNRITATPPVQTPQMPVDTWWPEITPFVADYVNFKHGNSQPDNYSYIYDEPGYYKIYLSFRNNAVSSSDQKSGSISKIAFAEKMMEKLKIAGAATGEVAAKHYFELANALYYARPWWGYSARLWNEGKLHGDYYQGGLMGFLKGTEPGAYPFNIKEIATELYNRQGTFVNFYFGGAISAQYYEKTASLSKNRELIAQALFCAKACSGNDRFFRKLKDEYSDTEFFARSGCSYLEDFK